MPNKISFHNALFNDFKREFDNKEMEDILDQNDEINVVIGSYQVNGNDEYIKEDRKLGSNSDATNLLFILNNVSKNNGIVVLVYCTELEIYQKKKK